MSTILIGKHWMKSKDHLRLYNNFILISVLPGGVNAAETMAPWSAGVDSIYTVVVVKVRFHTWSTTLQQCRHTWVTEDYLDVTALACVNTHTAGGHSVCRSTPTGRQAAAYCQHFTEGKCMLAHIVSAPQGHCTWHHQEYNRYCMDAATCVSIRAYQGRESWLLLCSVSVQYLHSKCS